MADRESVITHLQIIHTWAEFARERDLQFFTAKHLADIAQWAGDALNLLKEQEPTVDAVPVRHGRWLKGGYVCGETEWICSVCGETEWRTNCNRMIFCMFCGAKMDLEEGDNAAD